MQGKRKNKQKKENKEVTDRRKERRSCVCTGGDIRDNHTTFTLKGERDIINLGLVIDQALPLCDVYVKYLYTKHSRSFFA